MSEREIDRYTREHPQLGETAVRTPILDRAILEAEAAGSLAIDVGCGEGQTLALLGTDAPGLTSYGVELSIYRAEIAGRRGLSVLVADGTRLPIANSSVGLLLCRHVIEHVDDDAAFLQEMRRVLAPEGMLYLETPLRLPAAWYPYRGPTGDRVLDPTHVREYGSVAEIRALLTRAGFTSTTFEVVPLTYSAGHLLARALLRLGVGGFLTKRLVVRGQLRIRIPRYREFRALSTARRDP